MNEKKSEKNVKFSYDYLSHAGSLQDCTGLIPSLAANEAERESYESIYHFLPPVMEVPADDAEEES